MTETLYDNPSHWKQMHSRFEGSLRAVGRSGLSEVYNLYKYRSEECTFSEALERVIFSNKKAGDHFTVLDIGAGTGYWLKVVMQHAARHGVAAAATALDISDKAMQELKKNIPGASLMVQNAGTADPGLLGERFDLVMTNYCLHHITDTPQFNNALELAVRSVKPGGCLLIMDCLIDRKYSPYYKIDPAGFKGSGLSRPLKGVDKVCEERNMRRVYMADPISFLMNNVLEDDSQKGYMLKAWVWKVLHRLYKSGPLSRIVLPVIYAADRYLKIRNRGYSTRLVIYQKHAT